MMYVYQKANAALRHDKVYQNEIFLPKKIDHAFYSLIEIYVTVEQ